jgi:hypothetical protein
VIAKKIKFIKRQMTEVVKKLKEYEFPELGSTADGEKSYKYLTDMTWTNFTAEKAKELEDEYQIKKDDLEKVKTTPVIDVWKQELKEFMKEYEKWLIEQENDKKIDVVKKPKKKKKIIPE